MSRDSTGIRTVSGYNPKQKTDKELVESCTKEIKRLEYLLEVQKKVLHNAEKRLNEEVS